MTNELMQLLSGALLGKRIADVRGPESESVGFTGFDLVFDDGSEVEFYVVDGELTFVHLTTQEAEDARRNNQG